MKYLLEEAGFKIIKLETLGGAPEAMADLFSKIMIKLPFAGKLLAVLAQNTVRLLTNTKTGHKLSVKTGKNFPLGYALAATKCNTDG